MKQKCKRNGCYEPADCRHGYCVKHCPQRHNHRLLSYSVRSTPKDSSPHVGVEIEVEFPTIQDRDRALPLKAHHDGSLPQNCSAEFKLLAKADKIVKKSMEFANELWTRRARATRRCGLHVHLDMRQVTKQRIAEAMTWFKATQETWFKLMPPSRREMVSPPCTMASCGP